MPVAYLQLEASEYGCVMEQGTRTDVPSIGAPFHSDCVQLKQATFRCYINRWSMKHDHAQHLKVRRYRLYSS